MVCLSLVALKCSRHMLAIRVAVDAGPHSPRTIPIYRQRKKNTRIRRANEGGALGCDVVYARRRHHGL
jgi:hypothetical protein